MHLTRDDLARLCPRPRAAAPARTWDAYVAALVAAADDGTLAAAEIDTPARLRHLLATWAHETGGFTIVRESFAYSTPQRILDIFGERRHSAGITPAEARMLVGQPFALAERVYGLGNPKKARELGNIKAGDGWTWRGSGIQQITGRGDHERYAAEIGCRPEDLAEPAWSIKAALAEWQRKGCNAHADRDDVVKVRRLVNGGRNGLDDVRSYLAKGERIWPDDAFSVPSRDWKPIAAIVHDVAHSAQSGAPLANGVAGAAVACPRVLALGDSGADVAALQDQLARAGYPVGAVDGHFGALTERALVAWQHQHMLPVTGRADAATLATLEAGKPASAAPGRAAITEADLAERGSSTVRLWTRVRNTGRAIWAGVLGLLGLEGVAGIDAVEKVTNEAARVQSLAGKLGVGEGWSLQPRHLVFAALLVGAVVLMRWASHGIAARVDDARTGAHVGK
jgi:predicted chitinase